MAKRILNMAEESPTMVALRGWAELYEQREEYSTVTSQQALTLWLPLAGALPELFLGALNED